MQFSEGLVIDTIVLFGRKGELLLLGMGELCEGLRCWLPLSLYYIEGVGILTVGTIGLAINLAAMKLLVCAKPRHVFHHVLLSLTIYDFLQVREHPKETILMLPFNSNDSNGVRSLFPFSNPHCFL